MAFKYRTLENYTVVRKSKNWSKEDIIDRTGYLSLEDNLNRMVLGGVQNNRVIDEQYSQDWKDLKQLYENGNLDISEKIGIKRFNDLTDLDTKLREKMTLYNKSLEAEKNLNNAWDKYTKSLETERIKKEAINEYIAQRKSQNKEQ